MTEEFLTRSLHTGRRSRLQFTGPSRRGFPLNNSECSRAAEAEGVRTPSDFRPVSGRVHTTKLTAHKLMMSERSRARRTTAHACGSAFAPNYSRPFSGERFQS